MADRSVSVPMTLSDLERSDARNNFFFRRILTLVRSVTSLHLHKCIARFVSVSWVYCCSSLCYCGICHVSKLRHPHISGFASEIVQIHVVIYNWNYGRMALPKTKSFSFVPETPMRSGIRDQIEPMHKCSTRSVPNIIQIGRHLG